jgi:hypothetical protein
MSSARTSPTLSSIHVAALAALLGAAAGCTVGSQHGTAPTEPPLEVSAPPETAVVQATGAPGPTDPGLPSSPALTTAAAAPSSEPTAGASPTAAFRPGGARPPCQLPAPKPSEDKCQTDADCGVSAPCHAPACVAKSKSKPPDGNTSCTRDMRCDTADANRCACYQGRCALVPPGP